MMLVCRSHRNGRAKLLQNTSLIDGGSMSPSKFSVGIDRHPRHYPVVSATVYHLIPDQSLRAVMRANLLGPAHYLVVEFDDGEA